MAEDQCPKRGQPVVGPMEAPQDFGLAHPGGGAGLRGKRWGASGFTAFGKTNAPLKISQASLNDILR